MSCNRIHQNLSRLHHPSIHPSVAQAIRARPKSTIRTPPTPGRLKHLSDAHLPRPNGPKPQKDRGRLKPPRMRERHIHHARYCTRCARTMHGKSIRACVSGTFMHTGFPYTYMHGTQGWWLIVAGSRLKPRSSSAFPVLFEAAHIGIFFAA
jgi:hypothetical protein